MHPLESLRLTAHALQEASQRGDEDEIRALLDEQDRLIAELSLNPEHEASLEQILFVLAGSEETLRDSRQKVLDELKQISSAKKGAKQYRRP